MIRLNIFGKIRMSVTIRFECDDRCIWMDQFVIEYTHTDVCTAVEGDNDYSFLQDAVLLRRVRQFKAGTRDHPPIKITDCGNVSFRKTNAILLFNVPVKLLYNSDDRRQYKSGTQKTGADTKEQHLPHTRRTAMGCKAH